MDHFAYFLTPVFLKYFLFGSVSVIIAVTLLLFIILIIHKLHVEHREQLLRKLKDRYTVTVSVRMLEQTARIDKPTQPIEYEALGDVLIDLMVNVTGVMTDQLRAIAREYDIVGYYRKLLDSRSWVKRYQAMEKLGFLRLPELKPLYRALLDREKTSHVVSKAIWALSFIAHDEDLSPINRFLTDPHFASSKYKTYIYTNIIRSLRERGEEATFLKFLAGRMDDETMSVILKKDIIEACGAEGLYSAKETIIAYFRRFHDVPEMRISCIRALEKICAGDAHPMIAEGLRDADWRVRAVAAKEAHICPEEIIEPLEKALYDQNYHVRINAAQALKQMGEKGRAVLSRNTTSNDRFVRDVTHYVLADKAYA
jgi:hypothetical protein